VRQAPLVLLHGFTGAPASYGAVRALTGIADSRVCAPYLPGHGPAWAEASEFDARDAGRSRFETALDALIGQLQSFAVGPTNPALFVGYSLGARVALSLLVRYPDWFAGCILIGVNPGLEQGSERAMRRRQDELRAQQLLAEGTERFLKAWESEPLFASQRQLTKAVLDEQARVRQSHTPEGLAYCLRHLGLAEMPNYWPHLSRVRLPIHTLVGARDEKFVPIAQRMQSLVPEMTLTVVPRVGHNVVLEAPQAVASAIERLHQRLAS
jgi:2-succinyl-6-hydroxy-2,4-cyclohexadiene-1-carboxylate synthase